MTVVTSWTMPASLTPMALTPVRSQMAARAAPAPYAGVSASAGKKAAM